MNNPIHRWIKAHPYQSILLAWSFGALSVAACIEPFKAYAIECFITLLIVWLLLVRLWSITSVLVAAALLAPMPAKASEPQPALPYAIGAVVVIIGGVVTYKLVKYCQKKFPPNPPQTNDPPALATGDAYAAAFTYAPAGSCYSPAPFWAVSESESAKLLEIRARILPCHALSIESALSFGADHTEDAAAWEADLAAWGLTMNEHGSGESFSRNGVPIAAEASPIRFHQDPPSVELDGASARIIIEKSYDLNEWVPVFTTSVPEGRELRFQDATLTSQLFYRLTLLAP